MNTTDGAKRRKAKVNKAQTHNGRRHADRARRTQRQARTEQRWRERHQFKFRVKVMRYYRRLREQVSEKRAIERQSVAYHGLTLARWQPTEPWHFPLCASSIRQWDRLARREGLRALYPGPGGRTPSTTRCRRWW